jgi:uncharacterized repeat protein (TIGR02543 family)
MLPRFRRLLITVLLTSVQAPAQVQLNEIMASNTRAFPDIVDFEDYPDWLELKNSSANTVNLAGYYLSDDPQDPYKWAIPAGASIPANGFLLIMADGYDAAPGQTFPRGYWPWRSFVTERYHANFSLSSSGESLLLTKVTSTVYTNLVRSAVPTPAEASVWKYRDDGANLSTQWRMPSYSDAAWAAGPSELGYGDAPNTTVSFGADAAAKHVTTYFRHTFHVPNPAAYQTILVDLLVDDGAVVYLNGNELFRRNMATGEPTHQTLASATVGGADENTFFTYAFPATRLIPGDNLLAVEVHQSALNSSDLTFDLALRAATHTGSIQDSVTFTTQVSDVSYGRDSATPGTWKAFAESTPGTENTTAGVADIRVGGSEVAASPAAGVYATPQTITLSAPAGEIRYTLDGGDPTSASPLYAAPIDITTTTVLRARCFETGKPPGPILTRTWFIGETQGTLPYVSLVAAPDTLFGTTIGIYSNLHEQTSTNYGLNDVYKGKDAPAHVEYFAPGGTLGFRANCGVRIGGENNWVHPQKALNLAVRGKYGDDEIKYDLWPGYGNAIHTALTLRDGGDRWANEMLRDCMWPKLARDHLQVETYDYRPSVVFINGRYFGLHDLRERWDDTWFTQKYHVPPGEMDHLLYGHITSSTVTLGVDKGDTADWLELMNFLTTSNLTSAANWAFVESRIDMDSFMDFVIAESYGNNTSWVHNREFWKEKKPGAKWKWFLADMDRTLSTSALTGTLADLLANEDVLVRLKTNTGFKQRLAQRYAAHMAGTFTAARVQSLLSQLEAEISSTEVARHQARWAPNGMTAASRAAGIAGSMNYASIRATNVFAEITAQLGVPAAVDTTLALSNPAHGSVLLQGVPVDPGTIKLFPGISATYTAVPAPGYAFTGWTGATGGETITVTPAAGLALTAQFAPSAETVLTGTLAADTLLAAAQSPVVIQGDLIVPPGVTLTITNGVTVLFTRKSNLRVQGALVVGGLAGDPVHFRGRAGARWGGVSFESPAIPSTLRHLVIRGATKGYAPTVYPAAIAGLNATLTLDFLDIRECEGPVFCRGGSTTLRDSILQNPYTGDGINIKQGLAVTQRCVFYGNNQPDTDAIDYDGVANGLIEDCRIHRFQGFNSDGIDIGEECVNVLIQRNQIYYNSDKGFSVGQGSTVTLRQNLVVGCVLGVGVKDSGSTVLIDQNTFVDCGTGVAVYEKNFGDGGGAATITHCIFSKCGATPVTADAFSSASVDWSLCDTAALAGTNNQFIDPRFVDPVLLNFQLQPGSPAIDTGDPAHAPDPDMTVADRGAAVTYQVTDYPYTIGETVVINELLANSETGVDWIELYNRTQSPVDIGGWFLSDDGADRLKYRIPAGTVLPPGGFATFYEDLHFGAASIDTNKVTAFALSDLGETVHLSSAVNDVLTDYRSKEDFGATAPGETLGTYYKPSENAYNFIAMAVPTPNATNSAPRVGPVVISEIMYNPPGGGDADEYFELVNVSASPVTLYDEVKQKPWRVTDGVDYDFPASPPVTLAPGQRMLLARNLTALGNSNITIPPEVQRAQWVAGTLDNGGEILQIAKPGGVDAFNVTQYIRVDRVNYDDAAPWVTTPDGTGPALAKIDENAYGNDAANWRASYASAGLPEGVRFADWAADEGLGAPGDDPDLDGQSNLLEYALGTNPHVSDTFRPLSITIEGDQARVSYGLRLSATDLNYHLEASTNLTSWARVNTTPEPGGTNVQTRVYRDTTPLDRRYFRLGVEFKP